MAVYKVPQDVEAEDKLLGPFTFRQFVYLMIVAAAIAVGYGLSRILLPLAIIPLPVVIFFGALALPLRKDQPMETYLAAVIQFLTKPRIRIWTPDGVEETIEILAPKIEEIRLTKDISGYEAASELGYLAKIVDTGGWSAVNPAMVYTSTAVSSDVVAETNGMTDVLDPYAQVSQTINNIMTKSTVSRHDQLIATFKKEAMQKSQDLQQDSNIIQQAIVEPASRVAPAAAPKIVFAPAAPPKVQSTAPSPSEIASSPAIIKLANDNDLTVETIASQANRIVKRSDDEVVISLR